MSGHRKAGVIILLFLLSAVFFRAAFPNNFAGLSKPVPIKSNDKTTDQDKTQSETSSSQHSSSLPVPIFDIVIDPGHGGTDSGADKGDVIESEVTLDISKKLRAYLEEKAYRVGMTRSSDISLYTLSSTSGSIQRRELDARTTLINESGAKLFVSIHVNSYPEYPRMSGSIVYYNPLVSQSRDLSDCIQVQLNAIRTANYKRDTYDPQEADFYLLKNATIPGVLIETAFITNSGERNLLKQDNFRSQIAKAVADGIENYLNKH